jgi:hypothetical protein
MTSIGSGEPPWPYPFVEGQALEEEDRLADIYIVSPEEFAAGGPIQLRLILEQPERHGSQMDRAIEGARPERPRRPDRPLEDVLADYKRRHAERDARVRRRLARVREIVGSPEREAR